MAREKVRVRGLAPEQVPGWVRELALDSVQDSALAQVRDSVRVKAQERVPARPTPA
jgi:hypothetical protein